MHTIITDNIYRNEKVTNWELTSGEVPSRARWSTCCVLSKSSQSVRLLLDPKDRSTGTAPQNNKYCIWGRYMRYMSCSWVTPYKCRSNMFVGSLPDCFCILKPVFCHQVTRQCSVPSVCVLKSSTIQLQLCLKEICVVMHHKLCYHTELTAYLWQCDGVSQLSSPKNAL